MMDPQAVLECVIDQESSMVKYLEKLVSFETPSHDPASQLQGLALIEDMLNDLGYRVFRIPGDKTGGQLFGLPGKRSKKAPKQLLLGHLDTVWPHGTLKKMPVDISNGKFSGPGVYDMKAGVVQILYALNALQKLDIEPVVTPVVMITTDEEIGSIESRRNIELMAKISDRALVLEPSLGFEGKIKTTRKGVGHFDITIRGIPSHAGLNPGAGTSAILELSHVIQFLFSLNDPKRGISVNVGTVDGGLASNVIAPECAASVDVRILHDEDGEFLESTILGLEPSNPEAMIEVTGGINRGPMLKTPRNEILWEMTRELGHSIGLDLEEGMSGGASDGNFTSAFTATIDGLGAVGDGAHAYHEHILVEPTLQRTSLLALLIGSPPVQGVI